MSDGDGAQTRQTVERKNPAQAAIMESVIPLSGVSYAGAVTRGLLPAALSGVGAGLAIAGTQVGCNKEYFDKCLEEGNDGLLLAGVAAYVVGRIWGAVVANGAAREFNENMGRGMDMAVEAGPRPGSFGVRFSLPIR